MRKELHRLRRDNFKASKRLLQANKRILDTEEEIEQELRDTLEGEYPNGSDAMEEGEQRAHEEEEGELSDSVLTSGNTSDVHAQGPAVAESSSILRALQHTCVSMARTWWTYEVCLGRYARQSHQKDASGEAADYMLGHYTEKGSTATLQKYVAGDVCGSEDFTRQANVAIKCVGSASPRITSVNALASSMVSQLTSMFPEVSRGSPMPHASIWLCAEQTCRERIIEQKALIS